MHIDHSKLVELLSETSGLEQKTVEEYLQTLVSEINEALEEGEAYEVDGLGVFSRIGENTLFIPAEDFATEINYKYAGMAPIILDEEPGITESDEDRREDVEEDPFSGLLDDITEPEDMPEVIKSGHGHGDIDTSDVDDLSDPFALGDEASQEEDAERESDEEEFTEIPNEIDYSSQREEDESRVLFSGLLEVDEEDEDESEFEKTDHIHEQDESDLQSDSEFNELNVDDEEDSPFDLGDDGPFSDEVTPEEEEMSPVFDSEPEKDGPQEVEEEIEEAFGSADDISENDTEEDPFETLAGDIEDEEIPDEEDIFGVEKEEASDSDDGKEESSKEVVPVIKNVASEKHRNKKKAGKSDKSIKTKKPVEPASKPPAPVFLWVILFILIIGGGIYGLGYFGVVEIPGITPETNSNQRIVAQQNEQQVPPPQQANETEQQTAQDPGSEVSDPSEELTDSDEDPVQETTQQDESTTSQPMVPAGQNEYGMRGVPVESANDGYTIVIFSLSNQANAEAQKKELEAAGYRVLLAEIPSQQYGILWRVSLGQFETMRDAAIASEELEASLSENYFITKIQ